MTLGECEFCRRTGCSIYRGQLQKILRFNDKTTHWPASARLTANIRREVAPMTLPHDPGGAESEAPAANEAVVESSPAEEARAQSDAEFRSRSDRLRLLADRSLRSDDTDATLEILDMLEPIAFSLLGGLEPSDRDPSANKVLSKALQVLKDGLHRHYDLPLAFVIVVMRNEADSEFRTLIRKWNREAELPAGYEPVDAVAHAAADELHVRELLVQFVEEARATGQSNEIKVAEVLVVQYVFGVTASEACDRLVFSPAEKKTITEKIDKQRTQAGSKLCQLAEKLVGATVRPNVKRPRRKPEQKDYS
jgi:hypothetical protein